MMIHPLPEQQPGKMSSTKASFKREKGGYGLFHQHKVVQLKEYCKHNSSYINSNIRIRDENMMMHNQDYIQEKQAKFTENKILPNKHAHTCMHGLNTHTCTYTYITQAHAPVRARTHMHRYQVQPDAFK